MTATPQVHAVPVASMASLGATWQGLEAVAAPHSFFQSWTWLGCLAEERFPNPVLLRAEAGGRLLGLALFNRRGGSLHLGSSGTPALDTPYIEHNAPLLAAGAGAEVTAALFRAAWRLGATWRLGLPGVAPATVAAAGGTPLRLQANPAPHVVLAPVRAAGGDYLSTLSANSRQQLRRSARALAQAGPLSTVRASSPAEALAWLADLAALHRRTWQARGRPSAFALPFQQRFHQALVQRALAQGQLDLLACRAGEAVFGYLYNFRHQGRVYAYQSGFDLTAGGPQAKPGLTCHHLAIERALAEGLEVYDFLAGEARFKRSLANASTPLLWAELVPNWPGMAPLLRLARRLRHGGVGATVQLPG